MRLYLIGAGVIARTHAEAAAKLSQAVELRVADPNAEVLKSFRSSGETVGRMIRILYKFNRTKKP